MYEVIRQSRATRFYAHADKPLASKLARCFRILEQDPRRHPNIKALSGPLAGCYRFRTGDYRVVYEVNDGTGQVHVMRIAHRRVLYR